MKKPETSGHNPHYHKHRERLRERFRTSGFVGFRDYEALELLLTYAIPRKDVKPLAKELIARFKSLRGVLDAPFEELISVKGIQEKSATFLSVIKESASLYLRSELTEHRKQILNTRDLLDYCRTVMGGLKDEQVRVLFLNSQNEVITDEVLAEGTVNQSVVYPRKVIERALYHKATALILAHNHPSGSCKPSKEDRALTLKIASLTRELSLRLLDHLIICAKEYYSFLEAGEL